MEIRKQLYHTYGVLKKAIKLLSPMMDKHLYKSRAPAFVNPENGFIINGCRWFIREGFYKNATRDYTDAIHKDSYGWKSLRHKSTMFACMATKR